MASIRKRGNSHTVTVSNGYASDGTKLTANKTFKLDPSLTEKQATKEINRLADEYEHQVKTGQYLDGGKITFQEFAERWLTDHADKHLAPKTINSYRELLTGRIYPAIGHIKMQKLQPVILINFYSNLEESGMRLDTKYVATPTLLEIIKNSGPRKGIVSFSQAIGAAPISVSGLCHGKRTNQTMVDKISHFLNESPKTLFTPVDADRKLTSNSVSHYHKLLSSILTTAVQWQVIASNPADRVKPPKIEKKEAGHYNEDQVDRMLSAADTEEIRIKTVVYLVVYLGMRLGEMSGLEWKDIDFKRKTINIVRASQYLKRKTTAGKIAAKDPKNETSKRKITIPQEALFVLRLYQKWQTEQMEHTGDAWQRKERDEHGDDYNNDRLFTKWDGSPIFPDTPSKWFKKFRIKHGLPPLTFHQLRHTNASLMLAKGVDVVTVSKRLGHASPTTTMKIYAHALQRPDQEAADKLDAMFKKKPKTIKRQA